MFSLAADDNCTIQDLYPDHSPPSFCQNISLSRLEFLQDASVVYVVIGLLAAIFSCLTIYVICSDCQLHSKTYYLIATLSTVDLIASIGLIYCGFKRLVFHFLGTTDVMTQLECLYQETPLIIGFSGNVITFFVTAIDRLLAIIFPAWYQNDYPRWLYLGQQAGICLYIGFEVTCLYLGADPENVISICAYTLSSSQSTLFVQSIRAKVIVGATVLLYTFHIFWVRSKMRKARSGGDDRMRVAKRVLQVRVLITLICIVASFVLTTITSQVLYSFALSHTNVFWALKIATYSASLMCANSCTSFLIMYCRSRDFRQAVRQHVLQKQISTAGQVTSPRISGATSVM